jgi:DNA-binding IclR family transcriptional regulator
MKGKKVQKVEAVERALSILESFGDGQKRFTLGDISKKTGLYRSTILRLASSLEKFGYIYRDNDGLFRLGPTLLRLGVLYKQAFNLADYVYPVLQRLVDLTHETASFYVREGDVRICLYRISSPRDVRYVAEEGSRLPLDRGAGGRVLMAFTNGKGKIHDKVRAEGFYISVGERDPAAAGLAAPVFGHDRAFVGALGIIGPRHRLQPEHFEKFTKILLEQADKLSMTIGKAGTARFT